MAFIYGQPQLGAGLATKPKTAAPTAPEDLQVPEWSGYEAELPSPLSNVGLFPAPLPQGQTGQVPGSPRSPFRKTLEARLEQMRSRLQPQQRGV